MVIVPENAFAILFVIQAHYFYRQKFANNSSYTANGYDILWALDEVSHESSASHIYTLSEVFNEHSE